MVGTGACVDTPAPRASGDRASADSAQQAHIREVVAAGGVVDSVLPIAEHLARFRAGLRTVDTLSSASSSLEALVNRLTAALSTRDTAALNGMVLDRSEFAWLYYPGSAMSAPPYEAPPELLWGQINASSNAGIRKLLSIYGGSRVKVASLDCPPATADGDNRLHERCNVRFEATGRRSMTGNLFGTIIERDGRFKFLSYANRI